MFHKILKVFSRVFVRWNVGRNKFRKIKNFVAANESGVTVDAHYKSGGYGSGSILCEIAGVRFVMLYELEEVGKKVYQVIFSSSIRKEGENLPVSFELQEKIARFVGEALSVLGGKYEFRK